MKPFVQLSLILFFASSLAGLAAVPTKAPIRAEVREKITGFVAEARKNQTVREWIESTRLFSRIDKASLLRLPKLSEKMPEIKRRFNDAELVITVDGITADFANAGKGEVILNGEKIFFGERATLLETLQRIDGRLKKKTALRLFPSWLAPPLAQAEALQLTCIESKFEFMFRSPTALLESNFGYVGKLFVSGLVVASVNIVGNVLAHCDSQVEEMQQILRENTIGIKAIDCGSDATGFDRSIEFWVPERDEKGKFKTRTFNLDYTLLMAQEAKKDKEEKDEEEEETPKKKHEKGGELYIFGGTDLHEVRVEKANAATNKYECETAYRGTERFDSFEKDIEPFRKIFHYVGEFNSCSSCASKMLLKLRTPEAPNYFPPVPELIGPPAKGIIPIMEKKKIPAPAKKRKAKPGHEPLEKSHRSAE